MKSPVNQLIVECKDIYEYYAKHGTLELYVDPLFKNRKVIYGIVRVVPEKLAYGFQNIVPEVCVGDKIYFHYNSLDVESTLPIKGHYLISYDMVFCAVRDEKIIMIGGRIFCTPWYDPEVQEVEIGGVKNKVKMTKSGIITETSVKYDYEIATLAHIGTPLIGSPQLDVKSGDVIYYIDKGDFVNEIEGREYFTMFQEDLLMVK